MIFVIVLGVPLIVTVGWVILTYNGLVGLRNKTDNAWAQIDVQLHRRHDLIPNLVETVKGYASHEQETLERVISARNVAQNATGAGDQAQAENLLTGALKSLLAVSEAYPDLKADERFADLQKELTATEDRISYSRQSYNDSVFTFNTQIETFPTLVVANAFKFAEREYFESDDESRGPVSVDFS